MATKKEVWDHSYGGTFKYTPEGHWTSSVTTSWHVDYRSLDDPKKLVEVNWSCWGACSIAEAETFLEALKLAIEDAKEKEVELGLRPKESR